MAESKDQGAHSEMSRKLCITLVGVLEAVAYTAGYSPLCFLGPACLLCDLCMLLTALQSISHWSVCLWILIWKYSVVKDLHNLGPLCGSVEFPEHT